VLKLPLLSDIQQKVGELVFSITPCPSTVIWKKYFKLVYRKNVVMVTLTTVIMFILHVYSLAVFLGVRNFTKVVRAIRLQSSPRLRKFWETLI
jgi:hypothetical protein